MNEVYVVCVRSRCVLQCSYSQGKYGDLDASLVSYGPCQTPTLQFCVQRYDDIQAFQPETYYTVSAKLTQTFGMHDRRGGPQLQRGRSLSAVSSSSSRSCLFLRCLPELYACLGGRDRRRHLLALRGWYGGREHSTVRRERSAAALGGNKRPEALVSFCGSRLPPLGRTSLSRKGRANTRPFTREVPGRYTGPVFCICLRHMH